MTYRTNAKPKVRRRIDWGAVGARCIRALFVSVALAVVALVVWCWRYAFTHIGSAYGDGLVGAWAVTGLSGLFTFATLFAWWCEGFDGESGYHWYQRKRREAVIKERDQ